MQISSRPKDMKNIPQKVGVLGVSMMGAGIAYVSNFRNGCSIKRCKHRRG